MASKLDELLPTIVEGGDSGVTLRKITTKFVGSSKAKAALAPLQQKLDGLVGDGSIRGPFKHGATKYYFAAGRGPSVERAGATIIGLVSRAGIKLLSKAGLEKKVIGLNKRFFPDGLKHAISTGAIVELICGTSKYYLHRDVAADYFRFEVVSPEPPSPPRSGQSPDPAVTLESLLPAYRRLKAEQGGFSAVKIFDLMRAVNGSKDDLHRLLLEETKAGRMTIHPTTSVDLPKEVIDAGIRLPGFAEPFISVVVKSEP